MVEILEKDFNSFFKVPYAIRGANSLFAGTFEPDLKKMLSVKNPIFNSEEDYTYFTIKKNNEFVGRISVHIHHAYNRHYNEKKCYFGFFECIDDQTIADQLFKCAESFALKRACTSISGNFNLTAMQEMGVMLNGFDKEPYILQSYGMPYYAKLMTNARLAPIFPMSTYEMDIENIDPHSILSSKQNALLNNPEFEFIAISKKLYQTLKPSILELFNKGFENNAHFVPITMDEFNFQAKDLIYFMDNHISFLVKHNGIPIGVSIQIPDINPFLRATKSKLSLSAIYHYFKLKNHRHRALCIFSSIAPEYQNKGVLGAILYLIIIALKKRGFKKLGITWISETNKASLKKMEDGKATKLHDLCIFEKYLIH
ncbi:MAG: hypothetical protein ABIO44_08570 [Saprospiraceae bacterium]